MKIGRKPNQLLPKVGRNRLRLDEPVPTAIRSHLLKCLLSVLVVLSSAALQCLRRPC